MPENDKTVVRFDALPAHRVRSMMRILLPVAGWWVPRAVSDAAPAHCEGLFRRVVLPRRGYRGIAPRDSFVPCLPLHGHIAPIEVSLRPTLTQLRACVNFAATTPTHRRRKVRPQPGERRLDLSHRHPVRRDREELIAELGALCHCCGISEAVFVDHDHISNQVRGVVCAGCNHAVDRCLHPSGCYFANYLNNPPAARFHLRYKAQPLDTTIDDLWCEYTRTEQGRQFLSEAREFPLQPGPDVHQLALPLLLR